MNEQFKDLKYKNEYISREDLEETLSGVLTTIKNGEAYASVVSVSSSGMSRRIKFYRIVTPNTVDYKGDINKPYIENITPYIAWLRGYAPIGQFMKGKKHFGDHGLLVGGCGMDMIFHTLYSCMKYSEAKEWNQHYNTL